MAGFNVLRPKAIRIKFALAEDSEIKTKSCRESFILSKNPLCVNVIVSVIVRVTISVSGQNTIGIYITLLVLIQPTDVEQNAVNNNWLLKLQPAVKLQSWQKSNFHQIEWDLQIHNPGEILTSLICHNIYFYMKIKNFYQCLIKL